MANRYLRRLWAYLPEQVRITGKVTIGAAGAVGTVTAPGVASIARTAAGEYTITLQDKFNDLVLVAVNIVSLATPGEGEDLHAQWNAYSASGKTASFVCNPGGSATETDPANGDEIHFEIVGKNTSIAR